MNTILGAAVGVTNLFNPISGDVLTQINNQVVFAIESGKNIPGISEDKNIQQLRPGLLNYWSELVQKKVLCVNGTDAEVRPYFVLLQGIVEHTLACEQNKTVKQLMGVIHTPTPPTPLCTDGNISAELVDPSLANDELRLLTVKTRATIVRDFLHQGGTLYCVYSKAGLQKRTQKELDFFHVELQKYPSHLKNLPLDIAIDAAHTGAYYKFMGSNDKTYAFAIHMTQVNNPQELGTYTLWFGNVEETPIKTRIMEIENFLGQQFNF